MDDPPAFAFPEERKGFVGLQGAGLVPGVRQFSDDTRPGCANLLTGVLVGESQLNAPKHKFYARTGEKIVAVKKSRQINLFHDGWIPAAQRMALGIPLHPDRMTRDDWIALPGIGEVLADRLELDRQKNGEFGSLRALARVKGIGKKRIEKWVDFF